MTEPNSTTTAVDLTDAGSYRHWTRITLRFSDMDRMQHINNLSVGDFFETARVGFREEIHLIEGVTNVIDRPFFLPRVDTSSITQVNPNTTTVVTNANLGVTLRVEPNSARLGGAGYAGPLSVSLVPEALAPAALPEDLGFGFLITLQPVEIIADRRAGATR